MGRAMLSVYIHIPFCKSKCPYCDFYSACPKDKSVLERYTEAVCARLASYGERYAHRDVGTVYFGGGTPSVLGAERLCRVLAAVKAAFSVQPDAEVTVECNPADVDRAFFETLRNGGVNRISMGMQSANEDELRLLGRRHTAEDAKKAMCAAREAGIGNVSVDLMLALPNSDLEKLGNSIDFCAKLQADHVSAYILKIEPGTPFSKMALYTSVIGIRMPSRSESSELSNSSASIMTCSSTPAIRCSRIRYTAICRSASMVR